MTETTPAAESPQPAERTPAGESMLTATELTHRYGELSVLQSVDVDVPAGAVTAVVGPNGTGKTTLLRILLGQLTPTEGSVAYTGPAVDRPIGYLPQQPSFRPQFTAAETLEFYGALLGREVDTHTALDRVGLADAADRPVEALSGGMRRLLGIAQSLVGEPPVVVFDEPASGLDPSMSTRAFEILADRATAGTAIVVSSHDLGLVERFADRVLVVHNGTIAARGSPRELMAETGTESLWDVYDAVVHSQRGEQ